MQSLNNIFVVTSAVEEYDITCLGYILLFKKYFSIGSFKYKISISL